MKQKLISILIYHQLGLGDHIFYNGFIRSYLDKYSLVYLFCKRSNFANVSQMFSDNKNIRILEIESDIEARNLFDSFKGDKVDCFESNMIYSNLLDDYEMLGDYFSYLFFGIPYSFEYDKFVYPRDEKSEKQAYESLIQNDEEYIFVADDPGRGFRIDESKLPNLRKIRSNDLKHLKLHEMYLIMKNAQSCHVIWSSIFHYLDKMNVRPLFVHESYINRIDELNVNHKNYHQKMSEDIMSKLKSRNINFI